MSTVANFSPVLGWASRRVDQPFQPIQVRRPSPHPAFTGHPRNAFGEWIVADALAPEVTLVATTLADVQIHHELTAKRWVI